MLQIARNLVGQHLLNVQKLVWPRQQQMTVPHASAGWNHEAHSDSAVDEHTVHYSQSRYLPVWESICERIPLGSRVLEVGCGTAHFAHLLMDLKIPRAYVGFDVSKAAVEMALKMLPGTRVEVGDVHTTNLFTSADYDIVVCTEVLGRIDDDLPMLERIPREKHVLATVPETGSVNHGRTFESAGEVLSRYRCLFSSLEISQHHHAAGRNGPGGTSFLLNGVR
jgi:SAM-dependent methyltransferase